MSNLADYINGPASRYALGETSVIDTDKGKRVYATAVRVVVPHATLNLAPSQFAEAIRIALKVAGLDVVVFDE